MAEATVLAPPSQTSANREPTRSEAAYIPPPVDIYDDEQGLVLLADLPGVEPDALDARVADGVLTIQAKAGHIAIGDPVHREFQLTGFFRQFQLPEEVDAARISAELKYGVLTLRLPRAERAEPRRIQVRVS
ncbi:MAG: hypothetical protein QOF51_4111 [Chloroflexota bacterium]|jgi:HSP20 family molecular chaperone IbpA|nr:hypothetical protein [Chloroflexota bacterium]